MPVLFVEMFGCIGSVEVPWIWVIVVVNQKPATRRLETPVGDWVMKLSFDNFFLRTYDKVFPLLAIAKSGILMSFQMELWSFLGMKFTQSATASILVMGFAKLLLSPLWGDEFAASLSMATTQILRSWQRDDVLWRRLGKAFLDEDEACFLWAYMAFGIWFDDYWMGCPSHSVEGHRDG